MLICCKDQQKGLFGRHGFKNQVPWRPRDLMTMPIYANLCQSMPIYCTCPVICMLSLLPGQIHCQIKLLKQVIYGGRALEADFDNLTWQHGAKFFCAESVEWKRTVDTLLSNGLGATNLQFPSVRWSRKNSGELLQPKLCNKGQVATGIQTQKPSEKNLVKSDSNCPSNSSTSTLHLA